MLLLVEVASEQKLRPQEGHGLGIARIPIGHEVLQLAARYALEWKLSGSDAIYLALASLSKATWLTADERAARLVTRTRRNLRSVEQDVDLAPSDCGAAFANGPAACEAGALELVLYGILVTKLYPVILESTGGPH